MTLAWNAETRFIIAGGTGAQVGQKASAVYSIEGNLAKVVNVQAAAPPAN